MNVYRETSFRGTLVGEIPSDWRVVPLTEIGKVKSGKRVPREEKLVDFKTPFPYLRIVDFKNGTIDSTNIKYLPPSTHEKIKKYRISSDDVYLSIAGTIGLVGLVPRELDGANLTENAAKLCDLKNVQKEFLAYMLRSQVLQKQIKSLVGKGTQPKLALFRIEKLKIPLPPPYEQSAIVQVLSVVDEDIRKTIEIIAKSERLKKGMMQELLTRGIGHKEFKDTEIGKIPSDWPLVRLEEIGTFQYGYTTSAKDEDTGTRLLRITDIDENGMIDWSQVPYCEIDDAILSKYGLKIGDVLFARIGATTGKTGYVDKAGRTVFGSYLIRFRPISPSVDTRFLYFFTQSNAYWSHVNRQKEGQLKKGLNTKTLGDLRLPLPPFSEQQRIIEILSAVDRKSQLERKDKEEMEKIKRVLMDLLLTGKVRIRVG